MTTYAEYAGLLCSKMGWANTLNSTDAIVAWCAGEGSTALYNPLDTERVEPGDSNYNSAGVRDYTSLEEGLQAVYDTLNNGLYAAILQAFSRQDTAEAICAAIQNSPWGTSDILAVLPSVRADRVEYYGKQIGELSTTPLPTVDPSPTVETTPPPVEVTTPPPTIVPNVFTFPSFSVSNGGTSLDAVKIIQAALVTVWGYTIKVDGYFGPITEGAVKAFQGSHGLSVDGAVGEATWPPLLGL